MKEHPKWVRKHTENGGKFSKMKHVLEKRNLCTVCQEAQCPNLRECWGSGSVTFMILGDACSRSCKFCAVASHPQGKPDPEEPQRLAQAVEDLDLKYTVLTSVTRDDLPQQGAKHYAKCIRAIKKRNPGVLVEALIPDFQGEVNLIKKVVQAEPEVIGHNLETVKRLQTEVRDPRASYEQSLTVLETVKRTNENIYTKSSLMLGLGEREQEVLQAMDDLRSLDVDILTLGQYLRPTKNQLEVTEYIEPEQYRYYKEKGLEKGFRYVAAGSFVRSSYKSAEFFARNIIEKRG